MSRYLVTRTLPPLSQDELNVIGKKVVENCNRLGMQWVRSHITADGKHTFCEFEAPTAESCREHASLTGLPVDEVIAIGAEIGPQMFQAN